MTDNRNDTASASSRLDSLCVQAERLIENLRAAQLQADAIFGRPERIIADANATAAALRNLHEQTRPAAESMRALQSISGPRMQQFQQSVAEMGQVLRQVTEHADQTRAIATSLTQLQEQARAETTRLASLCRKVHESAARAEQSNQHSIAASESADQLSRQIEALQQRQEAVILSGGGLIEQFRENMNASLKWCERLKNEREQLQAVMDESRRERAAWRKLLQHLSDPRANLRSSGTLQPCPTPVGGQDLADIAANTATQTASPVSPDSSCGLGNAVADGPELSSSVSESPPPCSTEPQHLAERIRRLADVVREAVKFSPAATKPSSANCKPAAHRSCEKTACK